MANGANRFIRPIQVQPISQFVENSVPVDDFSRVIAANDARYNNTLEKLSNLDIGVDFHEVDRAAAKDAIGGIEGDIAGVTEAFMKNELKPFEVSRKIMETKSKIKKFESEFGEGDAFARRKASINGEISRIQEDKTLPQWEKDRLEAEFKSGIQGFSFDPTTGKTASVGSSNFVDHIDVNDRLKELSADIKANTKILPPGAEFLVDANGNVDLYHYKATDGSEQSIDPAEIDRIIRNKIGADTAFQASLSQEARLQSSDDFKVTGNDLLDRALAGRKEELAFTKTVKSSKIVKDEASGGMANMALGSVGSLSGGFAGQVDMGEVSSNILNAETSLNGAQTKIVEDFTKNLGLPVGVLKENEEADVFEAGRILLNDENASLDAIMNSTKLSRPKAYALRSKMIDDANSIATNKRTLNANKTIKKNIENRSQWDWNEYSEDLSKMKGNLNSLSGLEGADFTQEEMRLLALGNKDDATAIINKYNPAAIASEDDLSIFSAQSVDKAFNQNTIEQIIGKMSGVPFGSPNMTAPRNIKKLYTDQTAEEAKKGAITSNWKMNTADMDDSSSKLTNEVIHAKDIGLSTSLITDGGESTTIGPLFGLSEGQTLESIKGLKINLIADKGKASYIIEGTPTEGEFKDQNIFKIVEMPGRQGTVDGVFKAMMDSGIKEKQDIGFMYKGAQMLDNWDSNTVAMLEDGQAMDIYLTNGDLAGKVSKENGKYMFLKISKDGEEDILKNDRLGMYQNPQDILVSLYKDRQANRQ